MKKTALLCAAAVVASANEKFIPDISLIMDASYVSRSVSDDTASHLEVPSVAHGLLGKHDHGGHSHATYNAENGFNLNYAELRVSSNADPIFTLDAVFHFSEHDSEIEELYFTSNILGDGIKLKGGKFLSNFGYLNEQHHHYWHFADMPLVYEAFLGNHAINEKGLQLQYTFDLPYYLMVGYELLQGENEGSFGYESLSVAGNKYAKSKKAPAMQVGYIKGSYDLDETTIFGGLSFASGSSRQDHSDDEDPHAFSGNTKLYGADLVVLHQIDSYSNIKWQSELLYRDLKGKQFAFDDDLLLKGSAKLSKKQAGVYSQIIYKHDNNYAGGIRYESIFKNSVTKNAEKLAKPEDLDRYSVMLEYNFSEFARLRAQFNHDRSLFDEDKRRSVNSFILQANITIGAHGAHSF